MVNPATGHRTAGSQYGTQKEEKNYELSTTTRSLLRTSTTLGTGSTREKKDMGVMRTGMTTTGIATVGIGTITATGKEHLIQHHGMTHTAPTTKLPTALT